MMNFALNGLYRILEYAPPPLRRHPSIEPRSPERHLKHISPPLKELPWGVISSQKHLANGNNLLYVLLKIVNVKKGQIKKLKLMLKVSKNRQTFYFT